ncbi:MAG: 30S ribosomal protein S4 [Alphaproteobacteria bacterium]|nr:30S ribosomal protein S4 [Alphaproteobacteria bacterium]NDC55507.1 30S ribosomal protein S4 [Alphaproteobacteria bacterium]NDG03777.1 30S ribosomal protein S4 [Alphaproteobacteria bacterium]
MTKRLTAKHKIDRRLGVNLWGRPRSPINKREARPGQHGQRRGKVSDFGMQLLAKQRLKGYYANMGERQFRRYYQEALRRKGDSAENLIQLLERRLDAVVYRMKFAITMFSARQLINHGHVMVNGKRVNISSYQVKEGDVVSLRDKAKTMATVQVSTETAERDVPEYIQVDHKDMKGTFVRAPALGDVPYPVKMEPNLVIEYYSR